jgi:hypothetical protein
MSSASAKNLPWQIFGENLHAIKLLILNRGGRFLRDVVEHAGYAAHFASRMNFS